MKKQLRNYQQELLYEIIHNDARKLVVQLSTGGGKTVIFTELVKQLNQKTLILVDSIELVNQTYETFKKQDLDIGFILAGSKKIPENKIIVGMVESVWKRKEKLPLFELCIIDECHIAVFDKFVRYLDCRIIGFTATPVRLGRYKINENQTAQHVLADLYDDIICGKPIKYLIQNGYLRPEKNIYFEFDDSNLKVDASGDYTQKSMNVTFQSEIYKKSLRLTYETYSEGKKTMIFTSNCETNLVFLDLFKDKNAKIYDSKTDGVNRNDIVEWFRNTNDAILINTGCFTKGFDVCDVETIIIARATKSLSLYIQIAGRGARPTNKIEKSEFLLIDGGNNIREHQTFSFDRDWKKIFSDRNIKDILENITECEECEFTFLTSLKQCPECGWKIPEKSNSSREAKEFELEIKKNNLDIPKIDLEFHLTQGHTKYEALKSLRKKWVTFLKSKNLKLNQLIAKKQQLHERFEVLLKPVYLKIITSILKDSKHLKYETLKQQIYDDTIFFLQERERHQQN